jgi:hypothetical protein
VSVSRRYGLGTKDEMVDNTMEYEVDKGSEVD